MVDSKNWSWIEGSNNPAAWANKPRQVSVLGDNGFWQSGPSFLRTDYATLPVKMDFKVDRLEGEMLPKVDVTCLVSPNAMVMFERLLQDANNVRKLLCVVA